jgi:RNA polymerase sigma-70 factor (ECF subfamily)
LLHAALESLDAVPRQLVALAFLKGYTHDEIAGETGLPLGTVKSHIRRALMSLRDALAPYAATRL